MSERLNVLDRAEKTKELKKPKISLTKKNL